MVLSDWEEVGREVPVVVVVVVVASGPEPGPEVELGGGGMAGVAYPGRMSEMGIGWRG